MLIEGPNLGLHQVFDHLFACWGFDTKPCPTGSIAVPRCGVTQRRRWLTWIGDRTFSEQISMKRRDFLTGTARIAVFTVVATTLLAKEPPNRKTTLGLKASRFTLNGQSAFLLGVSYYGALGASEEFIRRDLDDLQRHGFNWLRVWATWGAFDNDVSAVDGRGEARPAFLEKLKWLVSECDQRESLWT